MKKIALGPQTLIYPMPAFLIGANVGEKPNFMTAAWSGIAASTPPMITVALQHHRYTLKGMRENGTFSVNVPSAGLVRETDYCGLVSGTTKGGQGQRLQFHHILWKAEKRPPDRTVPCQSGMQGRPYSNPWFTFPGDRPDRGGPRLGELHDGRRA